MRASTIPLLENEPLVVVRASFLALCDGDHCAAALLNNFVYWHDWCVTHGRYDITATAADPDHHPVDERWFWKTTEGLVNDDLLRLWGEKKVRAAAVLLETKGYAQSRFNPKNRYDRTKQYRLVPDRLTADLEKWTESQDRGGRSESAENPNASGKNAGCTESTTYGDSTIRPKYRMQPDKTRDVQTETTCSEITKGVNPSSSSSVRTTAHSTRTTEDGAQFTPMPGGSSQIGVTAALVQEWASERHIRRRRDDRSYGGPDLHWVVKWGSYCDERGIDDRDGVFQVLDQAKAAADAREQWRYWKYLDEQVQHAAERYISPKCERPEIPEPVLPRPAEDPNSEWAGVKSLLAETLSQAAYANWIEPTFQVGQENITIRVWVPDDVTRDWLENEYAGCIEEALVSLGPFKIEYTRDRDTFSERAVRFANSC